MPRYSFECTYKRCGEKMEVVRNMAEADKNVVCPRCSFYGVTRYMRRDYSTDLFNTGSKNYTNQLISHSMAIHPEQIAEHHQLHPGIELTSDGCPIFNNTGEHDKYLKKIHWEKRPSKRKRRKLKKLPC